MVRYRDNFLVLLLTSLAHTDPQATVQHIADTLHETLGMELTVECISSVLPSWKRTGLFLRHITLKSRLSRQFFIVVQAPPILLHSRAC